MPERDETQIAALLTERSQVEPSGDTDRLKRIDEQLKHYGYTKADEKSAESEKTPEQRAAEERKAAADSGEAAKDTPQGRKAPGKQTG